ncbi:hypothetical protein BD769DRAFT_576855 [Suillus cothurnatus]|nr:hypothetical protein BD769DRAFT_576855 [Suillus cothurnatus]
MQMFIPSILSLFGALLKGPAWLLQKVISVFFGRKEPPPLPTQSAASCSLSDSPYVYESAHSQHQGSYERTRSQPQRSTYPPPRSAAEHPQSPSAHQSPSQQRSTYPPLRPAAEHSQSSFAYQSPLQYTPRQPHRQPSVRTPAQRTPSVSPSVAPVIGPVRSHIPQDIRSQPHRQPSVRIPARHTSPVSPDVTPVTEPVRSQIPQTSRRFSGPELASRAPEVIETPIVIDPYEDTDSLRLKARNEGSRMEECFKQSREAFARNEKALAKQLSLKGEAHKANMVRLDKEASTKIFRENNQGHMSDRVDLHGLFVSEAKVYFSNAVRRAQNSGESLLYVIVGEITPKTISPGSNLQSKNMGKVWVWTLKWILLIMVALL